MSDQALNGAAAPAEATGPQFSVEKIYVKDVSFEAPETRRRCSTSRPSRSCR